MFSLEYIVVIHIFFYQALLGRFNNESKIEDKKENLDIGNDFKGENNVEESHPDFIIPISVHVTDVNDNTPQFVGVTPYVLNISELTLVSLPQLQVRMIFYYI